MTNQPMVQAPTAAFVGASWLALLAGALTFLIGLWNSSMTLSEKGFYFILLMYGLFSAVSLQKCVRDRLAGIHVTSIYYGLCWCSLGLVLLMILVGLWNATLSNGDKGQYAMSFVLSMFAAVAIQKNTRDLEAAKPNEAGAAGALAGAGKAVDSGDAVR